MYYYAVVDIKDIVQYIDVLEEEVTYSDYVPIATEDYSLVGKWYDRYGKYGTVGAFIETPISVLAEHSTTQISYKDQDVWLDEKLDSYATTSSVQSALNNYSLSSHTHNVATTSINGFLSSIDKSKLDGIEYNANNYSHPASHPASMISGLSTVATSGSYADLSNKPSSFTPSAHTHAQSEISGLSTALSGKANSSHTHAQSEITGLESALSGKASSSHTHTSATTSAAGFMSKDDKAKLDGIAVNANNYSHPATHSASMITGLSTVATSGSYADLSNKPSTFTPSSHTHAQSEISGLSSALSGKANSSHNHDSAYVKKALQMTADDGNVELSWSGLDVLAQFKALASGMHTAYSPASATNNPNTLEGFRFMCHKTGSANYGWIMAYGTSGSIYTGYLNNGTWQGWKCIFDANPQPLWTGGYYMTTTHTVTPTKTLSECRNGWLLLWSDFDPGQQANNTDFCTSTICKRAYTGQKWSGGEWYCDVPRYSAGTATDSESRVIKVLKIYDNKIVGTENNATAPRNDVVLRAVYEF